MRLAVALLLATTATAVAEPAACKPEDGAATCKQRCDAGSRHSCATLGIMHLRGEAGGKRDVATARRLLTAACTAKVAHGCGGLGSLVGSIDKDWKRARPLLEQGCTLGDPLACESVGGIINGADPSLPPPQDLKAAARASFPFYKRSCELGGMAGCGFAAAFVVDKLVPGTLRDALDLYVKACGRGMAIACRQAVGVLERGDPEAKALAASLDATRLAADLRAHACKLGDTRACTAAKP